MAKYASDSLTYYLCTHISHRDLLAPLRVWSNLKMGSAENELWMKDFDFAQLNSNEVKSIPDIRLYYEQEGKLYKLNSLLPERYLPNVLWTPIDRMLQVQLPAFNHHFFGINEKIPFAIAPFEHEQDASVLLTHVKTLAAYINTAPEIRLTAIKWVALNNDKVCLLGTPLLPIEGEAHWVYGDMIFPAGYHFDKPMLSNEINTLLNADKSSYILWNKDGSYAFIEKNDFVTLSLSSFRKSVDVYRLIAS